MRVTSFLVMLLLGLVWVPQAPAQPAVPRLAGTLPSAESAMLAALQADHLADRIIRIAADTNGHITVAAIVLTYRASGPAILRDLQDYVWAVARTVFAAVPGLNELDLTGFHQGDGGFDARRRDVTFSASITADEMAHRRSPLSGPDALGSLPHVWYYHALLAPEVKSAELERHKTAVPPPLRGPERTPTFSGAPEQRAAEVRNRLSAHSAGGVVNFELFRGDPTVRTLALTFDDGPVPLYTPLLLDTLNRLGLKATFFLIGLRVQQYPYLARAIARAGHELGNHSFHHVNLTQIPEAQLVEELTRTQQMIGEVTGVAPQYFRPPGGRYDPTVLRAARDLGLITVFWTDDPADYARPSPLLLEAKLLARVSNGGILLLHQGVGETIDILPQAVHILQRRGFAIKPVSGLLAAERPERR